jgi:hypothetical protein
LIPVRSDIVQAANPACAKLPYTGPYNCLPVRDLGNGEVLVASGASRYNPLYYAYVGTLARPWHGNASLYAMRIASMLLCAGLFAFVVNIMSRGAQSRWPISAALLAVLPTTVYSSTLAAPNGAEMLAGLAVWAALLDIARTRQKDMWAYAGLGMAAAVLVNLHTLGAVWLVLIFVSICILVGLRQVLTSLRPESRAQAIVLATSIALMIFEVSWTVVSRPNDPAIAEPTLTTSVWPLLPGEMMLWPLQAVAAFPFRDEPAPLIVYAISLLILSVLAVLAMRAAGGRMRLTIAFVALASYAVPTALSVISFSRLGLSWQGRYGMPFTVGLILLFGLALETTRTPLHRTVVTLSLGALMVMHASGQIAVLVSQKRDLVLVHATGWWAPEPLVLVVLATAAGIAWQRCLARRLTLDQIVA